MTNAKPQFSLGLPDPLTAKQCNPCGPRLSEPQHSRTETRFLFSRTPQLIGRAAARRAAGRAFSNAHITVRSRLLASFASAAWPFHLKHTSIGAGLVNGKEVGRSGVTGIPIKPSRHPSQVSAALKLEDPIGFMGGQWDGVTEAQNSFVVRMEKGQVLVIRFLAHHTAQSPMVPIGLAGPSAFPSPLDVLGRPRRGRSRSPLAAKCRTAGREQDQRHGEDEVFATADCHFSCWKQIHEAILFLRWRSDKHGGN